MKNIKRYAPTKQEWLEFRSKLKSIGELPADETENEARIKTLREQAEEIREVKNGMS